MKSIKVCVLLLGVGLEVTGWGPPKVAQASEGDSTLVLSTLIKLKNPRAGNVEVEALLGDLASPESELSQGLRKACGPQSPDCARIVAEVARLSFQSVSGSVQTLAYKVLKKWWSDPSASPLEECIERSLRVLLAYLTGPKAEQEPKSSERALLVLRSLGLPSVQLALEKIQAMDSLEVETLTVLFRAYQVGLYEKSQVHLALIQSIIEPYLPLNSSVERASVLKVLAESPATDLRTDLRTIDQVVGVSVDQLLTGLIRDFESRSLANKTALDQAEAGLENALVIFALDPTPMVRAKAVLLLKTILARSGIGAFEATEAALLALPPGTWLAPARAEPLTHLMTVLRDWRKAQPNSDFSEETLTSLSSQSVTALDQLMVTLIGDPLKQDSEIDEGHPLFNFIVRDMPETRPALVVEHFYDQLGVAYRSSDSLDGRVPNFVCQKMTEALFQTEKRSVLSATGPGETVDRLRKILGAYVILRSRGIAFGFDPVFKELRSSKRTEFRRQVLWLLSATGPLLNEDKGLEQLQVENFWMYPNTTVPMLDLFEMIRLADEGIRQEKVFSDEAKEKIKVLYLVLGRMLKRLIVPYSEEELSVKAGEFAPAEMDERLRKSVVQILLLFEPLSSANYMREFLGLNDVHNFLQTSVNTAGRSRILDLLDFLMKEAHRQRDMKTGKIRKFGSGIIEWIETEVAEGLKGRRSDDQILGILGAVKHFGPTLKIVPNRVGAAVSLLAENTQQGWIRVEAKAALEKLGIDPCGFKLGLPGSGSGLLFPGHR